MKNLFSVEGKVALVTGGTSGIGSMIARGLVSHGARTYIVGRNPQVCEAEAADLSREGTCYGLPGDLATLSGIEKLASTLASKESALHVLVNSAGAMYDSPIEEFSEAGWDSVMDLNLKSIFFTIQKLLPLLRAAAKPDAHASVVNIGSMGGLRVGPKQNFSYQASKAGLHHLTGSLAKRLGPEHITVNALAPGFFESKMTQIPPEMMTQVLKLVPRGRIGSAEDVAGAAIYLASRAGAFVTGAVIPVEGGMTL